MKILKLGTNKEGMGSYTDKKAKTKYSWSFLSFKNAKMTYCEGFFSIGNAKIRYNYGCKF